MKRDWLIFKAAVMVALGRLLMSCMSRLHTFITDHAQRGLAELDK